MGAPTNFTNGLPDFLYNSFAYLHTEGAHPCPAAVLASLAGLGTRHTSPEHPQPHARLLRISPDVQKLAGHLMSEQAHACSAPGVPVQAGTFTGSASLEGVS